MDSDIPPVVFLAPGDLGGFQPGRERDAQPASVPGPFLDAMDVRIQVFVREQKVPVENEFDSNDPRSCHWVVYCNPDIPVARESPAQMRPVGTVRLVPSPHPPHPRHGGIYWNGILQAGPPSSASVSAADGPLLADRSTSFHDGREPYVKLGRLAVLKEYRGKRRAGLLVDAALAWLRANPSHFDHAVTGQDSAHSDLPRWNGLVCVHAQEQAVGAWAKWGFQVDAAMGRWIEEGIPHVGMFQRLKIDRLP